MRENNIIKIEPQEMLLSLDIGTRTVVGVVGKKENEKFIVVDFEVMEHPSRAMYDGQIHDIEKVTAVAKIVKENLEKRLNTTLKHVAIAAAGRALKTYRVKVSREIDYSKEIDNTLIKSLEMEGILKAQDSLEKEYLRGDAKYYCVGHTVVNYYLNDGLITSLNGHRGNKIGADIIATFLPYVVVDSLYSVMNKIDLEVLNLTLEPIAAINAAIPPKLRLLNLALVDIGAGTSDIAITKDGTVVAYEMASIAGDEITEAIAKEFLLDFDSAEKLKIQLNKKESHTFSDIVGMQYTMDTDEIVERIIPSIKILAKEISEKIIKGNGKSPSVVFCIGGGSQIPGFTRVLAENLGIVQERVVVRGTELIEQVTYECEKLEGPEYITPIGIGMISSEKYEEDFIKIIVNDSTIKLFNTKKLVVSDALIKLGFNARNLISRRGKNLSIKVNGKELLIKGEAGEPAVILLNNEAANLDSLIYNNDTIQIKSAINGKDVELTISDIVKDMGNVSFNGIDIKLVNNIKVNGNQIDLNYILKDGDEVEYSEVNTVEELLDKLSIDMEKYTIYVNDKIVQGNYMLKSMDRVKTIENTINEESQSPKEDAVNDLVDVMVNGEKISMKLKESPLIFVDVFEYIDFDTSQSKGSLHLLLNGKRANYTDYLNNGDAIEIKWEK